MQSISIILSKAVVVSDITGVVSAQTSSFIFTVQTSCKSVVVYSMICHIDANKLERLLFNVHLLWENGKR